MTLNSDLDFLSQVKPVMRKTVKEVMELIRALHGNCEIEEKENKYKAIGKTDYVSLADKKAQELYVEAIKNNFPDFGIIAEEDELKIPCNFKDKSVYFTIDPLDGTSAYKREQSSGISTMVSLIVDEKIVEVFIGDAMTHEIYEYSQSDGVIRVRDYNYEKAKHLSIEVEKALSKQYVQLREAPDMYSKVIQELLLSKNEVFKGLEITGGSIGLMFARLWKGEVGTLILLPGKQAPWDLNPVIGISDRMGLVFLKVEKNNLVEFTLEPFSELIKIDSEIIVVHKSRINELKEVFSKAVNSFFEIPNF